MKYQCRLIVLLAALSLWGCTTAPSYDLKSEAPVDSSLGILVASITGGGGEASGNHHIAWYFLRNVGTNEEIRLDSHEAGFSVLPEPLTNELAPYGPQNGRVIVLALEPGQYEVSEARLYVFQGMDYVDIPAWGLVPFSVSVEAGKVTYAGNLHLAVEWGKFLGIPRVESVQSVVENRAERDLAVAHEMHREIIDWQVSNAPALGDPVTDRDPSYRMSLVDEAAGQDKISALGMSCKKPYVLTQDCSVWSGATKGIELGGQKVKIAGSDSGEVVLVMPAAGLLTTKGKKSAAAESSFAASMQIMDDTGIALTRARLVKGLDGSILGFVLELGGDGYTALGSAVD